MPSFFPRIILILFLLLAGTMQAAPFTAFGDGEKLVYRVGWGVFGGAGEITISAREETSDTGKPLMRITLTTTTRGLVRGLYKYESSSELLVERETGHMLASTEKGVNRSKQIDSRTDFDYQTRTARHRDIHRPGRNIDFTLPADQDPTDLLSALVDTRHWNLKQGEARDVLVFAGRELFPITVHAVGTETVETPLGKFSTLVLIPRMEKTPPRGIFARGGDIKVWLSQNEQKLPVRMQLHLNFGQAVLTLIQYTPPKSAAPVPPEPKS